MDKDILEATTKILVSFISREGGGGLDITNVNEIFTSLYNTVKESYFPEEE